PSLKKQIGYYKLEEQRRARPRVLLSSLRIDKADALPRGPDVTGKVSFQLLEPVGPEPHVRLMYYPGSGNYRCMGLYYLRGGLAPAGGQLTSRIRPLTPKSARPDALLVVSLALPSRRDGRDTIESNTLAALVRPLGAAAGPPKGKP